MKEKIAAIIPCFNVAPFYECEKVLEGTLHYVDQIILIDDGSFDGTEKLLDRFADKHKEKVHLIRFPENRGKGFALLAGMQYAAEEQKADILVTMDGDGQHLPLEIPKLADKVKEGADFVVGERKFYKMPFYSKTANIIITTLLRFAFFRAPIIDTQSGFRAFSLAFAQEIMRKVPGGRYEMEFLCLLLALQQKRKIASCNIPTIYINKNRGSHFRKIGDSLRILKTLFAYLVRKT
ncbi:MAG: glycosyltransferase family 2 protein [Verrucomicrobiota bacterium]|nr:glycosyltransferase family 2 protein [Verrucomicrobiota bacterium]